MNAASNDELQPGVRRFKHVFSPLRIGTMTLQNRLMMSCMAAGAILDDTGRATDEMIGYFEERARSRPGMMGLGAGAIMPQTSSRKTAICLDADEYIPSLAAFVETIHRYDTNFGVQLWEGGIQAGGREQLSPSGIGAGAKAVVDSTQAAPVIKVLSVPEIRDIVVRFADAAERCVKAGFDFVEIHAGHGYLISAFFTPHFNRRTDQYGGSFDNRIRFMLEILRAVRERVGDRITVGVKLNGEDFLAKDGWTLEDACRIGPILEREGADYLSVSAGVMGAPRLTVPPLYEKQGCYSHLGAEVRKHVRIPVVVTGRIKNPLMAEDMLRAGVADVISMGRAMIADSELVEKTRRGQLADIRPCLAECRGCIEQQVRTIMRGERPSSSCIVNPRVVRERQCIEIEGEKKDRPRRILVVGGGITGLEVARRAAFAGHRVTLCESRGWLGGQVRFAAMMPGRQEIGDILPWYERQLGKYQVEVRLNTTVDGALLDALAPEVVVVASGSQPQVPQSFTEGLYHCERIAVLMVDDVLEHREAVGEHILVIGGDQIGMEVADYLSEGGRQVCVAEAHGHFAAKLAANDRWYLVNRTRQKQVKQYKHVHQVEVDADEQVHLVTAQGRVHLPAIDTIVIAADRKSDRAVAELAERRGIETHVVGDAKDVESEDAGTMFVNIAQAYDLARHL